MVESAVEDVPAKGGEGPDEVRAEASWLGRGVALFTPVFAVAAGWLAGVVAQLVPGADLDETQVTAFMVAATTAALGSGWKWLQGWQQHERFVAEGKAAPVKSVQRRRSRKAK
ncbi:hypothetical protein [Actinomadura madurae]|uniref:hypothetical protein n=1 Tax=Actinomadura madurae TaxID=1993 RepID=UPI0020D25D8E|nr:hypothetical protein [Actinomadura madurae]MCQ0007866.1 hypothetical protein [Actinomadura madurae]